MHTGNKILANGEIIKTIKGVSLDVLYESIRKTKIQVSQIPKYNRKKVYDGYDRELNLENYLFDIKHELPEIAHLLTIVPT